MKGQREESSHPPHGAVEKSVDGSIKDGGEMQSRFSQAEGYFKKGLDLTTVASLSVFTVAPPRGVTMED